MRESSLRVSDAGSPYRVDLSQLTSKYIGETEKNLRKENIDDAFLRRLRYVVDFSTG